MSLRELMVEATRQAELALLREQLLLHVAEDAARLELDLFADEESGFDSPSESGPSAQLS